MYRNSALITATTTTTASSHYQDLFFFVFLFPVVCRVPYKFYPALTLFVVSFLVGYLHEVVGTSGKKKLNKGEVIYGELKGRKKNGFAFNRGKLLRGKKTGAR